ncbi:MAG TPA: YkgJ family cysteine cluster protein [Acidisphaera sp.]|nr:YkgJ family cysteine cluster protein [Acidisphaera sp.]
MPDALSCQACPGFCCKMAGYVAVSQTDIRRLAKHLGLTVRQFEKRHILKVTRKGEKLIKPGYETCQFLGEDHRCNVYEARPKDCRGYYCWEAKDPTVYDYARFVQHSVERQRADDRPDPPTR